jgi:Protein of unknown function (DUF1236)
MKTRYAIAMAMVLLCPGFGAMAQTLDAPTQPKVNLTLEQRHVIKEIVKDLKVRPAPAQQDISIGTEVPTAIDLQPMPADVSAKVPQIKSHLFFTKDNKVVLVEAKDRKIVDVIE